MPFDGMTYDPVREHLIAARERVAAGWCQRHLQDHQDRFCAIGALLATCRNDHLVAVEERLATALPRPWRWLHRSALEKVILFNDAPWRRHRAVLALFDRAIALAQKDALP